LLLLFFFWDLVGGETYFTPANYIQNLWILSFTPRRHILLCCSVMK
jgi:hypothetical protein